MTNSYANRSEVLAEIEHALGAPRYCKGESDAERALLCLAVENALGITCCVRDRAAAVIADEVEHVAEQVAKGAPVAEVKP